MKYISVLVFLIAVVLFFAQLIFVLIGRKVDKRRSPQSHWAVKLIQVFIGLYGFTVFALPWAIWRGTIDLDFTTLLESSMKSNFGESILIFSELLFVCFSLMITSSLIQIVLKINKKSVTTYLFEMMISSCAIIIGALLMKHIETHFIDSTWPMRIRGGPSTLPENIVEIRY